ARPHRRVGAGLAVVGLRRGRNGPITHLAHDVNDFAAPTGASRGKDRPLSTGELPAIRSDETDEPPQRRPFRLTMKLLAFVTVLYFFAFPLVPGFRDAWQELREVEPVLLVAGFGLEIMALYCYAPLMQAALGSAGEDLSRMRLFRIQMSTRALSSIVPGGSAASSALGYRLMTLSGVRGTDAGFALATVGLASAVVLNLILWCGLIVSIPIRGVNAFYGSAALAGIIVMGVAAALVFGLMEGQGRSERIVRWIARSLRFNEEKAAAVLHRLAERLDQLISDRPLLRRVAFWAALNWLFDAAALWVFLRAFGVNTDVDALIIAFGLANVLAAIPITPGGLGYVDTGYVGMLVGFGSPRVLATLGVASYRFAQFFFPILLGAVMYLSLRVGPWSINRRERLIRLRDLAEEETKRGESKIDFQLRFPTRDDTGELIRRPPPTAKLEVSQERFRRWRRERKS
ncbi:MAG TPA: lysylphosphatidylglycerol synthase transmembrane domain-containing protein, partial [Ilumatobacter sp.]|nr:lysylphosphatidylglycerol synthase transmembrane domain-containing protein [Ilumatobacter sp.]